MAETVVAVVLGPWERKVVLIQVILPLLVLVVVREVQVVVLPLHTTAQHLQQVDREEKEAKVVEVELKLVVKMERMAHLLTA